jgi:protein-S-isoprenylcysteine O-methyltransferase Ste14
MSEETRYDESARRPRVKVVFLAFAVIGGGFWLLSAAWRVLYHAQRAHRLATSGPYARMRHPQYVGFVLIMFGFLVQWPTLVTLVMFPILVTMYVLLAKREERVVEAEFGDEYRRYAASTPAFLPRWHLRPTCSPHWRQERRDGHGIDR